MDAAYGVMTALRTLPPRLATALIVSSSLASGARCVMRLFVSTSLLATALTAVGQGLGLTLLGILATAIRAPAQALGLVVVALAYQKWDSENA